MGTFSGWTDGGLLQTAGIAPSAYGLDIYLDAEEMGRIPMYVATSTVEPGEDLYIPKLGLESVSTRLAKTSLDNSTFAEGTDEQGQALTYGAIDDTAQQMMTKFQYVAFAHDRAGWNKMPQSRRVSYLNARRQQAARALASAIDTSLLSLAVPTLIPSANEINPTVPADIDAADLATIVELFQSNNWYGPIRGVCHTSQLSALLGIDNLVRYDIRGTSSVLESDTLEFRYGPMRIITHNGVYDDESDGYHNLFFAEGPDSNIAFQIVEGMNVDDWYDENTKSYKTSPDIDYAYALVDNNLAVTVQSSNS